MSLIQRFGEYAAAFEKYYATRDRAHIEPYFTDDAVYEIVGQPPFAGEGKGRDAAIDLLEFSCNNLDRLFAKRELTLLEGPKETDNQVWFRWRADYSTPGFPQLAVEGEETATFDGEHITRLEDVFTDETGTATLAYLGEHGEKLAAG